jgi:hypothetical protein
MATNKKDKANDKDKVIISQRAAAQRINRALAKTGQELRTSRHGTKSSKALGWRYLVQVDRSTGAATVVERDVKLDVLATRLGALEPWEVIERYSDGWKAYWAQEKQAHRWLIVHCKSRDDQSRLSKRLVKQGRTVGIRQGSEAAWERALGPERYYPKARVKARG